MIRWLIRLLTRLDAPLWEHARGCGCPSCEAFRAGYVVARKGMQHDR